MGYRKTLPGTAPKTPPRTGGRADGFTLIEMVIAVAVLGILSAAVAVNWSSFMQHQKLRQDALALHKEILSLKARAIEHNDTAKFVYKGGTADSAYISWRVDEEGDNPNPAAVPWPKKAVTFNKGITIDTTVSGVATDMPTLATNTWKNAGGTVEIIVRPDNLHAYANGRIVISSESSKGQYCIQKDDSSIKPEIYYRSRTGVAWKKA